MSEIENSSGHGKAAIIPNEVKGWSWGAFLLTWIWGIGNSTYRAFWCFVPIVNIIMWIALGLKGREWAWRNRRWPSVAAFKKTQKKWTIAGIVVWALTILFYVIFFGVITASLNHAEPTKLAISYAQQNDQFNQVLGADIHRDGNVQGQINTRDGDGSALGQVKVAGDSGTGRLLFKACKVDGQWYLSQIAYQDVNNASNDFALTPDTASYCS